MPRTSLQTQEFTILGCGTSTGVPLIFCDCAVCTSGHPKNQRLRCSAWVKFRGKSFLIDTGPDLRAQALRAKIPRVDAVLYTHPHADHLHGIDDLRSFNFIQKDSIPLYGNEWTIRDLRERFGYIFSSPSRIPKEGGGVPQLSLNEMDASSDEWIVRLNNDEVRIVPIPLAHGSQQSVGFRFDDVAYVTDCSYISETSLDRLKGLSVLFLDCIRHQPHSTHFHLDLALQTVEKVKPVKTYLTHLGHDFDYRDYELGNKKLPNGVELAYDGLTVTF